MKKTKIFFIFLAISIVAMVGCEKDFNFAPLNNNGGGDLPPNTETVGLNVSTPGGKGMKIASNQTINTDSVYYNSFWLTPATGANIPMGIWIIKDSNNVTIYQSAMPENGIDIKFPKNGIFDLEVSGTYQGSNFSFNNVTIIVTSILPPPPGPTIPTSPVRLYNFSVSGGVATVEVAISKAQWQTQSGANWFYLKRINNLNFVANQTVNSTTDSIFFTLSFGASHQTYVEFNGAFHDGSPGGVWLIPGYGTPPSILYTGATGVPYGGSENFFGFRFHDAGNGVYELRTHSGTLILSTSTPVAPQIPGNSGDGLLNDYQVRWSGYQHWFKTNEQSPVVRWRMGPTGTWNTLSPNPTIWAANSDYVTWEFPQLTGQVRWQNGRISSGVFVPDTTGMSKSMYYDASTQELIKYM